MLVHSTNPIADSLKGEIQFRQRIQFQFAVADQQYQDEYLAGLIEALDSRHTPFGDRRLAGWQTELRKE